MADKKKTAPPAKAPPAASELPPVPPFNMVFYPRKLRVDGEVGSHKFNYAFEAAVTIFHRPTVQKRIAELIAAKRNDWNIDRSKMNWEIFKIVVDALLDDLKGNKSKYAKNPKIEANPIAHCLAGQGPDQVEQIIDALIANAKAELQENLVVVENIADPKR